MAPSVASVSQANRLALLSCARDPARWDAYLRVLSQHVGCAHRQNNQSVLNCAALLDSGWADTSEAMTLMEWRSMPGCSHAEVAEGAAGVLTVKASAERESGLFCVQTIWPAAALTGLDADRPSLGAPRIDLGDKASRSAWETALSRLTVAEPGDGRDEPRRPVALGDFSPTVQFVVLARFGVADGCPCPLPPDDVASDARRLKDYCGNVSRDASDLSTQIERVYRSRLAHERRRSAAVREARGGDGVPLASGSPTRERDACRAKPRSRVDSHTRKCESARKPFLPHGVSPTEAYSFARRVALDTASRGKSPAGKDKGGSA